VTLPSVLERLFRAAERRRYTLGLALATPGWITVVRVLLERELSLGPVALGRPPFPFFAHVYVFYLALLVCLTALLARVAKTPWTQAVGLVSMGLTLGTVPPLIDVAIYGIGQFAYEYQPALAEFPWTLHQPPRVLPWGETIVLWSTIALMTLAALRARVGAVRVIGMAVGTWALVVLFLVLMPAGSVLASRQLSLAPSEWRNALFAVATFAGAVAATGTGVRLVKRTLHVALAPLICLLGASFKGAVDGNVALACLHLALLSAGFALANDFYDREEDAAAGRPPPLDESSAHLLAVVPLIPVLHVLAFRLELGLALLGFAIVSYAYHADPLRLKCVFPLSYKTEGFLGGLAFFAGLTAVPPGFLTPTHLWVALVVTLGTPAALVFKDWKDADADTTANVRTAFVVLEARGWPRARVRVLTAALLLVSLGVVAFGVAHWKPAALLPLLTLAVLGAAPIALGRRPALAVVTAMGLAELQLVVASWFLTSA
jgi:4-hydroxybenzoate polyprenyltransferase